MFSRKASWRSGRQFSYALCSVVVQLARNHCPLSAGISVRFRPVYTLKGTKMDTNDQTPGHAEESENTKQSNTKKNWLIALGVCALAIALLLGLTGFFVIPPIGAAPEGMTVWYWRVGLNISFVSSPDSLAMGEDSALSLLGRGAALSSFIDVAEDRVLLRLPYWDTMYEISTGGRRWEF